jgi:polyisoprenoid-binding protein YceI
MTLSTSRRRTLWIVGAAALAAIGAAAFVLFQVFAGDPPPPAALSSPSATLAGSTGSTAAPASGFEGDWALDTTSGALDDGTATYAGYRIDEELSGIGANVAAGRTQQVQGSLTIDGTQVTALDVTVDMTTLRSDDERRDEQLKERGLQTAAFPTASFTLTEPIDVGHEPTAGEEIDATATGELTLHGVTRTVEVPVRAQWTGSRIEVVASFDIVLADYQIEKPSSFMILSIADTGTVELHLLFEKA